MADAKDRSDKSDDKVTETSEEALEPISPDPDASAEVTANDAADKSDTASEPTTTVEKVAKEKKDKAASAGRKNLPLVGAVAGGVLLVAAAAAAVFYFIQYSDEKDVRDANEAARQSACNFAPILAGYDAKTFDDYVKKVLDGSTGDFKKEFQGTSATLKDFIVQGQVHSEVSDAQCGVKSGDTDHAEIVMAIGQQISSLGTEGRMMPGQLSMVATLDHEDGRWLVSKLDAPFLNGGSQPNVDAPAPAPSPAPPSEAAPAPAPAPGG